MSAALPVVVAESAIGHGEHVALRERVDAYFERMRDGHLVAGRIPGPNAVQMWSNDYLGLSGHPDIVKAQIQLLSSQSDGVFMSAVFLNETSLQQRFERQMASYLGAEAAVLCQSGWSANTGLVQALVDQRTPVYLDQFAHASLWEGVRMAGATGHAFRHNQPEHLERLIKRHGPGLILVDAIYSAYGTICPLAEITSVSEKSGCILAVDESHAIGVYGPYGEGLVHTLGLTAKVQYRTFSLSKAFATRAGMVAGPARVMTYFPYEARPAIFSSAVLQHEVAGLAATLKVVQEEDWRRQQLWYNTRYLRQALLRLGFAVDQTTSQIVALHSGSEQQTRALRNALEEHEIFGAVFATPATPKNHCIVRLSVNARLRDPDLDRVIRACASIAHERAIEPWPKGLTMQTGDALAQTSALDAREKATDSAVDSLRRAGRDLRRAADRWFDRSH
jgi:CAI-1 autoinducer synthase